MTELVPSSSQCSDWCGIDGCDPVAGEHRSGAFIATRGGAMGDEHSDSTVDVAPSVAIRQYDGCTAEVLMQANTWLRATSQSGWHIPGQLVDLLPMVKMTATRARHLSELLLEAADQIDRVNDRTADRNSDSLLDRMLRDPETTEGDR